MTTIIALVREIVEGASGWPEGSFAIFEAVTEPSWYVQFAGSAGAKFVVEVSDPQYTEGRPLTPGRLARIRELGFSATQVNYQRFTTLNSPGEIERLCNLCDTILTDVFALSAASDIKLTLELGDERTSDTDPQSHRQIEARTQPTVPRYRGELATPLAQLVVELLTDVFERPTGSSFELASADEPSWRVLIGDDTHRGVVISVANITTVGSKPYPPRQLARLRELGLSDTGVDEPETQCQILLEIGNQADCAVGSTIVTSVLTDVFGLVGCADLTFQVKAGKDLIQPPAPADHHHRALAQPQRTLRHDAHGRIADRIEVLKRVWHEITALHSHTRLWSERVASVSWAHKDLLPYSASADSTLLPWLSPETRRSVRGLWSSETALRTVERITTCRAPLGRALSALSPAVNLWDLLLDESWRICRPRSRPGGPVTVNRYGPWLASLRDIGAAVAPGVIEAICAKQEAARAEIGTSAARGASWPRAARFIELREMIGRERDSWAASSLELFLNQSWGRSALEARRQYESLLASRGV